MPRSRNNALLASASSPIIVGLDAIGAMFGRSRWAIARWIRSEAFPAARLPDGSWFTTQSMIEAWLMERNQRDPLVAGGVQTAAPARAREEP